MKITHNIKADSRLRQIYFWIQLGSEDIVSRYRRSILGVFWIVMVNSLTIMAIGFVYSALFGVNLEDYFPFLVVGYIIWIWISNTLIEMSTSLKSYRYIFINHVVMPISILSRVFARNLIIFFHNLPIIVVVLWIYGPSYSWNTLLIIPNFLLVIIFLFTGTGIIAFFSARYQDIQHLIAASVGVLFLITPIIWSPEILTERSYIASLNPFTHVVEILRAPLLGILPNTLNYVVCFGLLLLSVAGFVRTYRSCHQQYIFWV